jgi:DNA-binding transcriptional MerR regulator
VNDQGKSQNDIAESDRQARGMIDKLEAVDRRITPGHVARRFRELLDDIGDGAPNSAAAGDDAVASRSDTGPARPAKAVHSTVTARGTSAGSTLLADHLESLQSSPGALFEADGVFRNPEVARLTDVGSPEVGYRTPTAAAAAGVTRRQLDYWARTGLVEPSVRAAHGSGSQRLYSFRDILVLKVVRRLLDTGISLQQIRAAVQHLRNHGTDGLAQVTLMSDGVSVYECTSPDEVVDLLTGGQGIFGIALGRLWQEVAQELGELPAMQAADGFGVVDPTSPASGPRQGDLAKSYQRRSG